MLKNTVSFTLSNVKGLAIARIDKTVYVVSYALRYFF
jgi:hypothetical protein